MVKGRSDSLFSFLRVTLSAISVEALQKQDQVEYLLDVLLFGETEEKAALITDYGKDVILQHA